MKFNTLASSLRGIALFILGVSAMAPIAQAELRLSVGIVSITGTSEVTGFESDSSGATAVIFNDGSGWIASDCVLAACVDSGSLVNTEGGQASTMGSILVVPNGGGAYQFETLRFDLDVFASANAEETMGTAAAANTSAIAFTSLVSPDAVLASIAGGCQGGSDSDAVVECSLRVVDGNGTEVLLREVDCSSGCAESLAGTFAMEPGVPYSVAATARAVVGSALNDRQNAAVNLNALVSTEAM